MPHMPRDLRWQLWWETHQDKLKRPICWIKGHQPLHKFGLRQTNGWLCRRCGKYGTR